MSAKTSRSQVRSVSSTALSLAITGGLALASLIIASIARSLSQAARQALDAALKAHTASGTQSEEHRTVRSVSVLHEERRLCQQQIAQEIAGYDLTETEAIKVSTLASIAATPYVVETPAVIQEPLEALRLAASPEQAQQAQHRLLQAIEVSHHRIFIQGLTLACTNAAIQVGFSSVQTLSGPAGTVRVIATDQAGRALVTEIHTDPQRGVSLETEVVGVTDGSCLSILDAFDKALEELGVRASAPERKFTGGVCELAAAREFIRKEVRRTRNAQARSSTPATDESATRRSQRLNQMKVQQRQR